MGVVWAARHLRLRGREVAIKFLRAMEGSTKGLPPVQGGGADRFRLQHPNIVEVYDFTSCRTEPCIWSRAAQGEGLERG